MIDPFRAMLDVDPVDFQPDPEPQPAFMGDECRCKDCSYPAVVADMFPAASEAASG